MDEAQGQRGQRHVADERHEAIRSQALVARGGQPAQLHRQQHDQPQAQQKAGQRDAHDGEHGDGVIPRRAALFRRIHARRNRDEDGDQLRIDGQADRRLEVAGDQVGDGLTHDRRGDAKITAQAAAHPAHILHHDGVIQPQLRMKGRDVLERGVVAQHHRGGIARRQMDEQEDDNGNDQDRWDQRQQPLANILLHGRKTSINSYCSQMKTAQAGVSVGFENSIRKGHPDKRPDALSIAFHCMTGP